MSSQGGRHREFHSASSSISSSSSRPDSSGNFRIQLPTTDIVVSCPFCPDTASGHLARYRRYLSRSPCRRASASSWRKSGSRSGSASRRTAGLVVAGLPFVFVPAASFATISSGRLPNGTSSSDRPGSQA